MSPTTPPQDDLHATALWCQTAGQYALLPAKITPTDGAAVMNALASAISRGTERLVLTGNVPKSEADRMTCPHQEGQFPFPVKYGYALVGRIVAGPSHLVGRMGFALHPHQTRVALDPGAIVPIPEAIPPERATLAANMETALNVVWDSGASLGDDVLVVGAGVVGLLITRLLARMPGVRVTATDVDPNKARIVGALGARFCPPDAVGEGYDVAINASASDRGLALAIEAAGLEARIVEASWHGARDATVPLGGAFHSQRLTIVSSQVGRLPATRAPRWTHRRRMEAALGLLDDTALDALITHRVPFLSAPSDLPPLMDGHGPLAIILTYDDAAG
ncbi:MAG: zinc-binding alcohol dehydrogenase [Pseudomonadota bacterium]